MQAWLGGYNRTSPARIWQEGAVDVSTVDIPNIENPETPENPSINSPELGNSRTPASGHGRRGGWLLIAGTARCGDTAILANRTAGCR